MKEPLVTFETAKLAKEKGFDEECMHYWEWHIVNGLPIEPIALAVPLIVFTDMNFGMAERVIKRPMLYNKIYWPRKNSTLLPWLYARPTQDLLEKWLREKDDGVLILLNWDMVCKWSYHLIWGDVPSYQHLVEQKSFDIHEEAREAAIAHALKLLPDA